LRRSARRAVPTRFTKRRSLGKADQLLGDRLNLLLVHLNTMLAAQALHINIDVDQPWNLP
jgi:hypothetical protein